jgi:integrase
MSAEGYHISFHDLRHINASVMAALGIPDLYAMQRGGWSNTATLKQVYQQTFDDERISADDKIDRYFCDIYATKYDTKNKKVPKTGT